jgi:hypothetical protein
MMGWMVRRGARRVADQAGDVDLDEGEVVEVEAPRPDACRQDGSACVVRGGRMEDGAGASASLRAVQCIPRTMISATRYGSGSTRLKPSSAGSTAGSPSMAESCAGWCLEILGRLPPGQHSVYRLIRERSCAGAKE